MSAAVIGSGIVEGLVIALVAVGFTIIFNATGVVNYANGQLMLFGGYLSWMFQVRWHWSFGLTLVVALPLSALLAILVDRIVIGPLRTGTLLVQIIALVALASFLDGTFRLIFGADPRNLPNYLPIKALVPGLNWSATDIAILVAGILIMGALVLFFYRTDIGTYMRAAADNPLAAGLVGTNPNQVALVAWGIGGVIAATAGILILPKLELDPSIGLTLTLLAFSAVVLGGFGSLTGAVLGGLIIGLAQAVVASTIGGGSEPFVSLMIMLVVLTLRPKGLIGERA